MLLLSCLDPTQVKLEIHTDALCVDLDETHILVGSLGEFDDVAPSATTKACADDGRIGDIVLVPSEGRDQAIAFEVVAGVGVDTNRCAADDYERCIVARRALTFIPHEPLTLPIELDLECLGIPCEATETCRKGLCVSAVLEDPRSCTEPGGCEDTARGGGGAAGTGGAASTGGTTNTGGASLTGGAPNSGGSANTGGALETGGQDNTGGEEATGGMGGDVGTGGDISTGGDVGTGGDASTGGQSPLGNAHLAVVTTTSDLSDGDTSSLEALSLAPGDDGEVSLREAILAANLTPNELDPDRIEFAIPGSGVHTISVASSGLPDIVDAVDIDGYSQSPGNRTIEIDGALATTSPGLTLAVGSSGSRVTGLVINGFGRAGLLLIDSAAHTVQSCVLGLSADGVTPKGNQRGIELLNSPGNLIGGALNQTPSRGNVISGNNDDGCLLAGATTAGNVFQGNIVGLDVTGSIAAGNGATGLEIADGAGNNLIGSSAIEARNIISANRTHGIRILGRNGGADDNRVQGNFIGTDKSYSTVNTLGNRQSGVRVLRNAQRNLIGGPEPGDGNRIAYNGASGVRLGEGTVLPQDTAILGNWYLENAELGIELFNDDPDFVTANDPGDTDTGSNGLQNYPEIISVSYGAGEATIDYSLDTEAGTYRIEFFSSESPDNICAVDPLDPPQCLSGPGGIHYHGEGQRYRGSLELTVGGTGPETFQAKLTVEENVFLSLTATKLRAPDTHGATSEFSRSVPTTFP